MHEAMRFVRAMALIERHPLLTDAMPKAARRPTVAEMRGSTNMNVGDSGKGRRGSKLVLASPLPTEAMHRMRSSIFNSDSEKGKRKKTLERTRKPAVAVEKPPPPASSADAALRLPQVIELWWAMAQARPAGCAPPAVRPQVS